MGDQVSQYDGAMSLIPWESWFEKTKASAAMFRITWKRGWTLGFGGLVGLSMSLNANSALAQRHDLHQTGLRQPSTRIRPVVIQPPAPELTPPLQPGQGYPVAPDVNPIPVPAPPSVRVPNRPLPLPLPQESAPVIIDGPRYERGFERPSAAPVGLERLGRVMCRMENDFDELADEVDDDVCGPYKQRFVAHAKSLEAACRKIEDGVHHNADLGLLVQWTQRMSDSWSALRSGLVQQGRLPGDVIRLVGKLDRGQAEVQQILAAVQTPLPDVNPELVAIVCDLAKQAHRFENQIVAEGKCHILARDVNRLVAAIDVLHQETKQTSCPHRLGAALNAARQHAERVEQGLERTHSSFQTFRAFQAIDTGLIAFGQRLQTPDTDVNIGYRQRQTQPRGFEARDNRVELRITNVRSFR